MRSFVLAVGASLGPVGAALAGDDARNLYDWRVALGVLVLVYGSVFALVVALFRAQARPQESE
jgi:hypothetical protein